MTITQPSGAAAPTPPPRLDLTGYVLDFDEDFAGPELDVSRWLPYYLPQWSSREASAARYGIADGRLTLRVDADQPPWHPELDGATRVSSLQTGLFAGPVGTPIGQHRFHPAAVVREPQATQRLYTPERGVVELRAAATRDPDATVALWMIGFEDSPERSAEICVCEIFGRDLESGSVAVGVGLHPFGDPDITDDFRADRHAIDATEMHSYAVEWTESYVAFYLDHALVRVVHQSPRYPMQLMLNIYDFGDPARDPHRYPKEFVVEHVRGYRPASPPRL